MSKKLELLRRGDSAKSSVDVTSSIVQSSKTCTEKCQSKQKLQRPTSLIQESDIKRDNDRQKTFKTFFHRIGSTGMLNHKSSNSLLLNKSLLESNQLYRSSSTSQLNSLSYIKCDDPTDGINLLNKSKSNTLQPSIVATIKSSSCDDIVKVTDQTKKGFPYAFLRSKLSVLPEENGGSVLNQKRLLENHAAALVASSSMPTKLSNNSNTAPNTPSRTISEVSTPQCNLRRFHYATSSINDSPPRSQIMYSRNSSLRQHSSDECSSNMSNSPRASTNLDWDPAAYQRLSSCLSSNESGYDSDGRHTDDTTTGGKLDILGQTSTQNDLVNRRLSTCSINSAQHLDCTIRRRFRQIKLNQTKADDTIGLVLTPQYFNLNDMDAEIRYLISDIDVNGLAYG